MNNNYIKQNMLTDIKNVCANIDVLAQEASLQQYKSIYYDKTAVIVTDNNFSNINIEITKNYRNKFILFSTSNLIEKLSDNQIYPDFIIFQENINQYIEQHKLFEETKLIMEPIIDRKYHENFIHSSISYPSQTTIPNLIWTEFANIDATPYYSNGSQTYSLLNIAQYMGFKNIILFCKHFSENNTKEKNSYIMECKNITRECKNNINLYLISSDNSNIEGFLSDLPEELLKNSTNIEKYVVNSKTQFDIAAIQNNIIQQTNFNKTIIKLLNTAKSLISNYDKEYHNASHHIENRLKYFRQLLMIYIDLKNTYAPKNRLFLLLQQIYSLDLESLLTENKENKENSVNKVYEYLKIYMDSLYTNLIEVNNILKVKVDKLNEMLNTKS